MSFARHALPNGFRAWLPKGYATAGGTVDDKKRSQLMIGQNTGHALELRSLAARFRTHAAETSIALFRRKFESAASEWEEAALDAETRSWASPNLKRAC
jgi:hypothetical protein